MRACVVWIGLIELAVAATAHGEPGRDAGLVWQAPAGCPDAVEVRARIEHRLGRAIDRMAERIAVDIAEDGGPDEPRFVARIAVRGAVADDRRVLTGAHCGALADAVAIVVARVVTELAAPPVAVAPVIAIARPELVGRPRPAPLRDWGGGVQAIGLSGIGAQPGVGLGGEVAGYARHRSVFAALGGARWRRGRHVLREGAPGAVDIDLSALTLRLGWDGAAIPLRGYVLGELGMLDSAGVALADAQRARTRWLAVGAGFSVAWPFARRARLIGTVELAVPLVRPRFVLADRSPVFRPDPATPRCGFGLEVGWR